MNSLTHNEIIKSLENMLRFEKSKDNFYCDNSNVKTIQETLDFINCQQAEIERLEKQLNSKYKWENMLDKKIKEVKTEAIEGFTERFKTILAGYEISFIEIQDWSARNTIQQVLAELDNFIKEEVGEGDG